MMINIKFPCSRCTIQTLNLMTPMKMRNLERKILRRKSQSLSLTVRRIRKLPRSITNPMRDIIDDSDPESNTDDTPVQPDLGPFYFDIEGEKGDDDDDPEA
ncbi:hypothetical protein FRX31_016600 [Thalictrum thalictroides]|uniref:Uncharacterized protein n=1 Tax=Thalictrum thalictroides TaxID=46969 RepID=A0A7J6W8Q2_THATH|nr:hypothetical protein FRX31_016600 [Thalictrum thalictroides]